MRDKPRKYDIGDGRQVTVAELAKKTGINKTTLRARLNSGWTGDQLMTPPRKPDDVPVYDFGNGHHLTIAQASKLAGISSNMTRRH